MGKFIDLTGKKFGRLRVLSIDHRSGRYIFWRCACECGVEHVVEGKPLRDGQTRSCGCLRNEVIVSANTTHGMKGSPEYRCWQAMWNRCTNANSMSYPRYRHLRPPEEWRSFPKFLSDVGPRPSPDYSLERLDNELPYGPDNTVWATKKQQNRNTRRNLLVTLDGVHMSFSEACELVGLAYQPTYKRWVRSGDMYKASRGLFQIKE